MQQQANMSASAGKQDAGAGGAHQKQLEAEIAQLKSESQRAQSETERLLQLMQMSQEEQSAKDKTIRDLQE